MSGGGGSPRAAGESIPMDDQGSLGGKQRNMTLNVQVMLAINHARSKAEEVCDLLEYYFIVSYNNLAGTRTD